MHDLDQCSALVQDRGLIGCRTLAPAHKILLAARSPDELDAVERSDAAHLPITEDPPHPQISHLSGYRTSGEQTEQTVRCLRRCPPRYRSMPTQHLDLDPPPDPHLGLWALAVECTQNVRHQTLLVVHALRQEKHPHPDLDPHPDPHLDLWALIVECAEEVGHQPLLMVHALRQVKHPVTQHVKKLETDLRGRGVGGGGGRRAGAASSPPAQAGK